MTPTAYASQTPTSSAVALGVRFTVAVNSVPYQEVARPAPPHSLAAASCAGQ